MVRLVGIIECKTYRHLWKRSVTIEGVIGFVEEVATVAVS